MDQLFDPDSPPAATEWEQGTVFDRAASIIERLEQGHRKGGAKAWTDVYAALRANADNYRTLGMTHFAEKLDLARARAVITRHQFHGPPLPDTLNRLRELLPCRLGAGWRRLQALRPWNVSLCA